MDDSDSDGPGEPALAVDDGSCDEFDANVPPASGSEYLRRVRQEAQGCPKVVVANIDTRAFLEQQTVKVTEPSGLLPVPSSYRAPMAWQRLQVAEFAQIRQKLIQRKALVKAKKIEVTEHNLPLAADAESWCRLCFGRMKAKTRPVVSTSSQDMNAEYATENGTPPLLSIVALMNQQQVESVLEYHINWLEATGFSSNQGRWLFALLANLQKPLTPEMCSWLRRLSRLCSNIRASLESTDDPSLQELNLIICLVSRYFEQRDLADS